jgi:hypothetical protein
MRKKTPGSLKKTISGKKPIQGKKGTRGNAETGKPSASIHQGVGPEAAGHSEWSHEVPEDDILPEHEGES